MEQNTVEAPSAIVVLSAGIVPYIGTQGKECWRTTTLEEGDAFGTLGGRDRVEAAAVLAQTYPEAYVVTTSRSMTGEPPTLASVYAAELRELGIAPERIVEATDSTSTESGVMSALTLAQERGWNSLLFVSTEYHVPRVQAFYERAKSSIKANVISSEAVLSEKDPLFAAYFKNIETTHGYQERLAAEARGLEALRSGTYRTAGTADKRERPV